ncbi:arylsulfatase [Halopseudomonas pachastrellae]|uniref:arylsulfatase n=1 Tax=Halopseudomonas pachastrellae TaxID=254161 RepID=UPI003D7D53AE
MSPRLLLRSATVLFVVIAAPVLAASDGSVLPLPAEPFSGVIKETFEGSKQDYPQPVKPPEDAPNVVLILLDDLGFGQPGTFGGPVPTPSMDELANQGLRYTRFHTTGICSPTRAALLTGRNHHQVGFGTITELSTGYPGYNSLWPRETASVAEILKDHGYSTAAFGKWHNTPDWETSPVGPFEHWPTSLGFEYWYGFQGGETSQWEPQLFRNTTPVEPVLRPEQGYNLNVDLVDDAIGWISQQQSIAPDKPYFLYFAPGAVHAPLHVSEDWIERFSGQFDQGWDQVREQTLARQKELGLVPDDTALSARPDEIEAWDSLDADAKRLYAKHQEVFAGFLAQTDHEVGRLIEAVRALPDGDNTLIIYIAGDNGPSAEGSITGTLNNIMTQNGVPDTVENQLPAIDEIGGPAHENHYPVGWAWAGSAPFQWMKRVPSHFGGTRNGMIVSWPTHIKNAGGVRSQFHHVVDVAPTILDAVGVVEPKEVNGAEQIPMAGVSMNYTFADADAAGTRHTQYFETGGHRALYHDGWVAASFHGAPWQLTGSVGFENNRWELYNVDQDFSQSHDLASRYPDKLAELQAMFDQEAKKFEVYPMDDRFAERAVNPQRPSFTQGRSRFSYAAGTTRIPEGNAPPIYQRSHVITAEIEVPEGGGEGVLIATGGSSAGYTLYLDGGVPVYEYNFFGQQFYRVAGDKALAPGRHTITLDYQQQPLESPSALGGTAVLSVDGNKVAEGEVAKVVSSRFSATETMDIGMDLGASVSKVYRERAPFTYNGTIEQVVVELK